jgi:cyclohexanecarboxylate-CoA ligase
MERPRFDPALEREFVSRGWWRNDTLARWLSHHAAQRGDAPALAFNERVLTWRMLEDKALRVARGLKDQGVSRGDVVAVQLPNTPDFIVAYLAICRLGGVLCTLHMPYRGAEVQALMKHSGAVGAFCVGPSKSFFPPGTGMFSVADLEKSLPLPASHPEPEATDPFLLLYTSGTTAAPKGVPHPYRTMLGNARLGAPEHGLSSEDRILCPAPFSHLYGLYSLHCASAVGHARCCCLNSSRTIWLQS